MFFPQEMTEIELVVPERDVLAVSEALAEAGVFHQVDASHIASEAGYDGTDYWHGESSVYSLLERRILAIVQALEVDEGQPPSKPQAAMVEIEEARKSVEQLEQATQELVNELGSEQERLTKLQRYVHQLEPIVDLDIEVGALHNLHYIFAMLGLMPSNRIDRLNTSLARIPFALLTLRRDSHQAVVLLLGAKSNSDILQRAARSAYLNPLNLPESYGGTPTQIIQALRTDIEHAEKRIAELKSKLEELRDVHAQELRSLLWGIRLSRILTDAMANFGRLKFTYVIVGWVPSAGTNDLIQKLKQVSSEIFIETNRPKRYSKEENVPVALDGPSILRPFQQLVTNYGWPRYEEIDPTFLVTLTFPLLFGAMFGDVGHGLMLVLLGWLLSSRRVRVLRSLANLGPLITVCGLVAMAFGFLYGSLFGFEDALSALWLRPMSNITLILATTIGAGVMLLSVGFVVGIINAWAARDWGRLFFHRNGVAGLVLYWSLIGLAATTFMSDLPIAQLVCAVIAAVAGSAVMLSEPLSRIVESKRPLVEGGMGTYIVQAFFEVFETLIGLVSNSLSYVRVGAFAVAHAGLSAVVFILAESMSPTRGIGYWIVIGLGNLFIVGFEGLIVGIQSLRLEYYEFFSKFFSGGGKRYAPLTLVPKTRR